LLAAGLGTRLRPLTQRLPKCLVPIAGRPLLDYWIDQLIAAGISEVLINTHHLPEQVRSYMAQVNAHRPIHLIETYEPQLLGSAGTLTANPEFAADAEQIMVIYADNYSTVNLSDFLAFHQQHSDPVTMLLFHTPNPKACGIAELDEAQRIIQFEEKPQQPRTDLANAGVYLFDQALYQHIIALNAFDLGFDVLPQLKGQMRGWVWNGYHRDVGTYDLFLQAQRDAVEIQYSSRFAQGQPAVFLDRDGTIIEQIHYLSRPEQVQLIPGAAQAIRQLQQAGFVCVVVSNQSTIGQGIISEADLATITQVLVEQLAEFNVQLTAFYHCPEVGLAQDRTTIDHYDRKPGPGMLFKAAEALQLDLTRSWMIGDMLSDVLAGYYAHCQGSLLVATGKGLEGHTLPKQLGSIEQVPDLATAAQFILNHR